LILLPLNTNGSFHHRLAEEQAAKPVNLVVFCGGDGEEEPKVFTNGAPNPLGHPPGLIAYL
jgi:hypothetical protein